MATATSGAHPANAHRALLLPIALAAGVLLISLAPRVAANVVLAWSFRAAAAGLLAWLLVLHLGSHRALSLELRVRKQHYIQALVQTSIYLYWGYFWSPVYDHAWLLLAQLLFAYAADMLLTWSRRESYVLGFGAFPIVLSVNLFLWFKDDWFYMQFLLVMVGLLGKEFVRWQRDGVDTHIFNPSAFTLALFSLVLIVTGTTELTWGPEIAATLTLAPHIYVYLFLTGLVVMYYFAITAIAATAAAVLFALGAWYAALTGVPYFLDSEIPAAVFLGLHLLVTDPSTSPRSALGKTLFGALYGLGVFVLYSLLEFLGTPTFYDKLLCVPLLNLSVRGIDRFAQNLQSRPFGQRAARLRSATSNIAHMGSWSVFFVVMTLLGKTDGRQEGDRVPFWQQACREGRRHACERLIQVQTTYCTDNSAWACNELGVHLNEGRIVPLDTDRALQLYAKACELRFSAACNNLLQPGQPTRSPPHELDLRLLLREGGRNLLEATPTELHQRACEHGWQFACKRVASQP
jgi:hypothetical protein